jgi:hypothetical protein
MIGNTVESLKSTVSRILKRNELARNDDRVLILEVLKEMNFDIKVNYDQIDAMPSFESITRVRRMIQNDEQKFTSDDETYKKRAGLNKESKEYWTGMNKNSQMCY